MHIYRKGLGGYISKCLRVVPVEDGILRASLSLVLVSIRWHDSLGSRQTAGTAVMWPALTQVLGLCPPLSVSVFPCSVASDPKPPLRFWPPSLRNLCRWSQAPLLAHRSQPPHSVSSTVSSSHTPPTLRA